MLAFFHSEVTLVMTSHLPQLRPPQHLQRLSFLGWTPLLETFWTWTWGDPPCSSNKCIPHSPPHRLPYRGVAAWIYLERDWILWLVYTCMYIIQEIAKSNNWCSTNKYWNPCVCFKIVHVIKPTYNRGSNMQIIIYSLFDDLDTVDS